MLTIDPEFKSLIPPLTPEERAGLEDSIAREGCRDPLVVWTDTGILLDGHHRHEICGRLGKPYNTIGLTFAGRDGAREWVIRNQFSRRNLTPWQRVELGFKLEDILRPAAEARMLAGKPADPTQIFGQGAVDEQIAAAAGVSDETIRKARYVRARARPAVLEALGRGETTIHAEYTALRAPVLRMSSYSFEWYSPREIVEAARRVLGEIDLDPASCVEANKTVRAARFYDEETDGLTQEWHGRAFINPPYCGLAKEFVRKMFEEYRAGRLRAAVMLINGNSFEAGWWQPLFDCVLCFVRGRIPFSSPTTEKAAPTHGSAVAYLGPHEDRFIEVFSQFGPVVKRVDVPAAVVGDAGRVAASARQPGWGRTSIHAGSKFNVNRNGGTLATSVLSGDGGLARLPGGHEG
jgi:phage N-6-adenine-methyltransferase